MRLRIRIRKGWEVTFEDGTKVIYTDQDYAILRNWLSCSTSIVKKRVFILSN